MSNEGDKGIQAPPVGGQTNATSMPNAQDLIKEIETLKGQYKEAERKITELSTEKSTLEQRVFEVENYNRNADTGGATQTAHTQQNDMDVIVKLAQSDPALAIQQLGMVINNTRDVAAKNAAKDMQRELEAKFNEKLALTNYLAIAKDKIKENDLSLWQNEVLRNADDLVRTKRISYDEAIGKAVEDMKQRRETEIKKFQSSNKQADNPPPAGAKAEGDSNPPPPSPPPEVKEETRSDHVKNREAIRLKRIYGLK